MSSGLSPEALSVLPSRKLSCWAGETPEAAWAVGAGVYLTLGQFDVGSNILGLFARSRLQISAEHRRVLRHLTAMMVTSCRHMRPITFFTHASSYADDRMFSMDLFGGLFAAPQMWRRIFPRDFSRRGMIYCQAIVSIIVEALYKRGHHPLPELTIMADLPTSCGAGRPGGNMNLLPYSSSLDCARSSKWSLDM